MSNNKKFFSDQSEITKLKLLFFENYIESYLYKILPTFGSCRLFDPFSGPGKAADNQGSPLALLWKLKKVVGTQAIKDKIKYDIMVFFSDSSQSNITNLESEILGQKTEKVKIYCKCQSFEDFYNFVTTGKIATSNTPKFIFLDPFGYSQISIDKIQKLASIPKSEILLFVPLMDIYRFCNQDPKEMEKASRQFLETYTNKPMTGGKTFTDPKDLMMAINSTLASKLSKYVRPMMFDGGSRKNCLFLITSHLKGLILANELFCQNSGTRLCTKTKSSDNRQGTLEIDVESTDDIEFKAIVTEKLKIGNVKYPFLWTY